MDQWDIETIYLIIARKRCEVFSLPFVSSHQYISENILTNISFIEYFNWNETFLLDVFFVFFVKNF